MLEKVGNLVYNMGKRYGGVHMNIEQNLALFRELMLCDGGIYSWTYDGDGKLLSSNCQEEAVLTVAFDVFGCRSKMLALSHRNAPVFLHSDTGLVWGAAFEKENGALCRCHVIGPVFYSGTSVDVIYHGLVSKDFSAYSAAWVRTLKEALFRVPTSQYTVFSRYLKMLHYCVTGQRVDISDIFVQDIRALPASRQKPLKDRHRVYTSEKAMLEMVKLGDLNYKDALNASMAISDGVGAHTQNPVRNASVSAVVFCSIVCRAAIEGGLSPEEAYSVGDAYIQSALDAASVDEISTVCISMYDDFIRRVHRIRENPKYTEPIQRCCNYIEMNIDRNIRARDLAELVGYSAGYITKRFRRETGFGISDYVKLARIERAKILLTTSDQSIQDISDQLGFTTRNYFTRCFRDVTGMTPKEFRNG